MYIYGAVVKAYAKDAHKSLRNAQMEHQDFLKWGFGTPPHNAQKKYKSSNGTTQRSRTTTSTAGQIGKQASLATIQHTLKKQREALLPGFWRDMGRI